ncbi:MAG TPA: helix-turn-helix domain-containing protein [Spirochaetota bacterium]|nr:helix-turn-helix domain-containing protein [Spirochaetota bacterium]
MECDKTINYKLAINRVIDYINNDPEREFTLAELSKIACISKYHFHRIFKVYTGYTLFDYIKLSRLRKSAFYLLHNPEMSLTDIAYRMGFSSSSNYARDFKKKFGYKPKDLRKKEVQLFSVDESISKLEIIYPEMKKVKFDWDEKNLEIIYKDEIEIAYERLYYPYYIKDVYRVVRNFLKILKNYGFKNSIDIGYVPNEAVIRETSYDLNIFPLLSKTDKILENLTYMKIFGGKYALYRFWGNTFESWKAWAYFYDVWFINSKYEIDDRPAITVAKSPYRFIPTVKKGWELYLPIK